MIKNQRKKKIVITYGTFDLTHIGHINLLRRARALGDYLIVGLATDSFNRIKNKECFIPFKHRKATLKVIKYVDKIISEKKWEQKIGDIIENDVDIFVIGEDWKGKFDFLKDYCEVVYLKRTKGVSTTLLKNRIMSKMNKNLKSFQEINVKKP